MTTPSRLAVLLFTDLVDSTSLKQQIGTAAYVPLIERHNTLFTHFCAEHKGDILKRTGDGFFATFPTASDAVLAALRFQRAMRTENWTHPLSARVGIHVGEVAVLSGDAKADVVGVAADLAARVMGLAGGGQILLTRNVFNDARQFVSEDPAQGNEPAAALKWIAHGAYLFQGVDEPIEVFEVGADSAAPLSTPPNAEKAKRVVPHDQEQTLGWRPAVGLEILGRAGWKLERKLGEGGFGEVWLGINDRTHQHRVFKFCFDVERLRSFKRELTLFRLLREALGDRPDIAKLYEVKLDQPPFFLESEHTNGGNLAEWGEALGGLGKLPLAQRIEIVAQVASATAAAHSIGVLHKDIKPSNILIQINSDKTAQPRLADFGIGMMTDRSQLAARQITETGFTVLTENDSSRTGTRMYAPPESTMGLPFTMQGDIYALGVLLYQMVIADLHRPLAEGWERQVSDELLRGDIATCVDGDPARRFSSAAELAERLRALPQRRAELDRVRDNERREFRRQRRRRIVTLAGSLFLLCGSIGAVLYSAFHGMQKTAQERMILSSLTSGDSALKSGETPEARRMYMEAWQWSERMNKPVLPAVAAWLAASADSPPPLLGKDGSQTLAGGFDGHRDKILAIAVADDGRTALSGCGDGTVRLWDLSTGREMQKFDAGGAVADVRFSPDKTAVIWITANGQAARGDIASGKITPAIKIDPPACAAISSDCGRLLAGYSDGSVQLFELTNEKPIRTIGPLGARITCVEFSPDGRRAIIGGVDRLMRICDLDSADSVRAFDGHLDAVTSISFSADGKTAVTGSLDHTAWVWDVETGAVLQRLTRQTGEIQSVALAIDGSSALIGATDGTLKEWNCLSGALTRNFSGPRSGTRAVAFIPGAPLALSGNDDGGLRLWNLGEARDVMILHGHLSTVWGVAFSPDGKSAVSGSYDRTARLWDLASGREMRMLTGHLRTVSKVAFTPDGKAIIGSGLDGTLRLWDAESGREIRSWVGHAGDASTRPIQPNENMADAATGKVAQLLDLAMNKTSREIGCVAVSPDGRAALSGGRDQRARLWNLSTGSMIHDLVGHTDSVRCAAFSPDGRAALTGSADRLIKLWDLSAGKEIRTFTGHSDWVNSVAFLPDGKSFVSAGRDKHLLVWDLQAGKPTQTLSGHASFVNAVAVSPDGTMVLSAGDDKTARLWSLETGEEVRSFAAADTVHCAAFSADGRMAIFGAGDKVCLLDFSRPRDYREFVVRLAAAREKLDKNPTDATALLEFGRWFAFCGADSWAVELLHRARDAGASVAPLELAPSLWRLGKADEARSEYEAAVRSGATSRPFVAPRLAGLKSASATSQPSAPNMLETMEHRAHALRLQNRPEDALAVRKQMADVARRTLPPGDDRQVRAINDYADLLTTMKRYAEAEPLFQELLESLGKTGGSPEAMSRIRLNMIRMYQGWNKSDQALMLRAKLLETLPPFPAGGRSATQPASVAQTIDQVNRAAFALRQNGQLQEAAGIRKYVVAAARRSLPAWDERVTGFVMDYVDILLQMKQYREGEAELLKLEESLEGLGDQPRARARTYRALIRTYDLMNNTAASAKYKARLAAIRAATTPATSAPWR